MRLKSVDGPLSIHNGNGHGDILNSPKRINTIQNSNVTNGYHCTTASNLLGLSNVVTTTTDNNTTTTTNATACFLNNDVNGLIELQNQQAVIVANDQHYTLNNINSSTTEEKVQWCNASQQAVKKRELLSNNANNNRNQLLNINNNSTLAASLRTKRTASSIYSESSPDDSLLDFEDVPRSVSSTDASPQDEERGFEDASDSESSDEGNLNNITATRGIVNPNYPGFQHLAHTLDYSIKSDTDYTDDDECDSLSRTQQIDANNINNNNIEEPDDDFPIDHIDSVNRLDSVENIQKVFYDKPINITEEDSSPGCESSGNSNQTTTSDEEASVVELNIKTEEATQTIVGDFGKEVEKEFGRISLENQQSLEEAVIRELDEAISSELGNLSPIHYNKLDSTFEGERALESPACSSSVNILNDSEVVEAMPAVLVIPEKIETKVCDAFLSDAKEQISIVKDRTTTVRRDSNRELEEIECQIKKIKSDCKFYEEFEKFSKEELTKAHKEKDEDSSAAVVPRKKEKLDCYVKKRRDYNQQFGSLITFPRGCRGRDGLNRRSVPMARDKKRASPEVLGGFDVYNIETAMPKIDLEAIESHLRAAREEERRRRTDREEIRRRLAMGTEDDYYTDRPGRKPSLQARLQSGMNLQICFMNETVSDTESPSSDSECPLTNPKQPKTSSPKSFSSFNSPQQDKNVSLPPSRPATLSIGQPLLQPVAQPMTETDFFARQARLQTEARMALAQAKEMARMQMEIERQRQKKSPITEMVRHSLEKVGIPFPEEKRRLSRQILTEMNVAQLQVIVNDLHTQIETLNENLVKFLMDRDDLHMEQDSMLVDIEDLTRYLGAKEQVIKEQHLAPPLQCGSLPPPSPAPSSPLAVLNSSMKPHLNRIASLVKK